MKGKTFRAVIKPRGHCIAKGYKTILDNVSQSKILGSHYDGKVRSFNVRDKDIEHRSEEFVRKIGGGPFAVRCGW